MSSTLAYAFRADTLPAIGTVLTVRVIRTTEGVVVCQPVDVEPAQIVSLAKARAKRTPKAADCTPSEAFWNAVHAANVAFHAAKGEAAVAPRAATPSKFKKLRFLNKHGDLASVKQPLTFACPAAEFWPVGTRPADLEVAPEYVQPSREARIAAMQSAVGEWQAIRETVTGDKWEDKTRRSNIDETIANLRDLIARA